jgi:hypothetical protein
LLLFGCSRQNLLLNFDAVILTASKHALRIFFRIINDFVNRFILDRTLVDFTVSLLILPFDIVDFNSKMVKSTVKP